MKEKVFAVQPARMIYPFHQLHHLKRTSLPRRFFWGKHQLPTADEGERKRVRRGRKSVPASRCFNLFTSCQWKWWPAEGFFFFLFLPLSWHWICTGKTHSWRHTLNKCNLYSMMNTTKKADRTRPSSHTDFTDKSAAFVLNMWSVAHAASANLSPECGAKVPVWLLRTT